MILISSDIISQGLLWELIILMIVNHLKKTNETKNLN
jgi:hypothetical protein